MYESNNQVYVAFFKSVILTKDGENGYYYMGIGGLGRNIILGEIRVD